MEGNGHRKKGAGGSYKLNGGYGGPQPQLGYSEDKLSFSPPQRLPLHRHKQLQSAFPVRVPGGSYLTQAQDLMIRLLRSLLQKTQAVSEDFVKLPLILLDLWGFVP